MSNPPSAEQRHRERVRVATRLFDRNPSLRPSVLPAEREARAKALAALPREVLEAMLGHTLAEWIGKHPDAQMLLLTLSIVEISEVPVAPSLLAELLGGASEREVATWVKVLEEHGLVRLTERTGWISPGMLLDAAPAFALAMMSPEVLLSFSKTYYSSLAAAPEDEEDSTPYMASLHSLRVLALMRLFPRGEVLRMVPEIAGAFVELAILENSSVAMETIPHAEETLALAMRLVEDGTVDLDSEGRVHLLRMKALHLLRKGEMPEALEVLDTARPLAAGLEPEVRMAIESTAMAALVEMKSPGAGEQSLVALRLAREIGDRESEELALTIRFQWLCEQGEELQLLEEHDAEALRVRPLEPCVERQVYVASAEAMHRDEEAGIATLKSIIARARRTKEQFILARAIRRHAAVHEALGRRSKAAGLYRQAVTAASDGGHLGEVRDVLAELARVLSTIPDEASARAAIMAADESLALGREGPPSDWSGAIALRARIRALSICREWKRALQDSRELLGCARRTGDMGAAFAAYSCASNAHTSLGKPEAAGKAAIMALWVARELGQPSENLLALGAAHQLFPGTTDDALLAKAARIDRKMRAEKFPLP